MRAALIWAPILALTAAGLAPALAQPAADRPDETALRYYAAQKQEARVAAESARLRRQHPGWQPPADLWTAEPGGEDEGPLWDLLGADRLTDLQTALAERARTEPGWKPSAALTRAIVRRDLRRTVLALAKAGRWADLAATVERRRAEAESGDLELTLAIAEALGRTERAPEAVALLRRLIVGAEGEARRAVLLRAMAFLPMAEIDRLADLSSADERVPIRTDLTRGRIAAVLHDEAGQTVPPDDLAAFETYAEAAGDPNQPALVAWLAFKRRDFPTALTWFKRAMSRGGDAMVAHGLAHTLDRLGYRREAEEVAYVWREPLVNNTLLFIDLLEADLTRTNPPPIEAERLRRYAQVAASVASGEGAQALAWYAYNNCQFDTALGWFRRAVAWFPKEATVYGYALTLRRLHQEKAFLDVVNRYDGLFPKVVDLLFRTGDRPTPCGPQPEHAPKPASAWLALDARAPAGRVPSAEEAAAPDVALPKIARSQFPVAVAMENDLRAAPTGQADPALPAQKVSARTPTIARRVPGVGPMPYERFGFALKPAWNGEDGPSSPTAAEKPAPVGSLWSDERLNAPHEAAGRTLDADRTGSIRRPPARQENRP
ncbi:hypothetical protein [Methylorubrum salsuginis]|uniref:Tetratricopeptide repeat-containing protein n=1 Tax=Methylorubrum salsuginis TaxID=414703 RepID=A0A1I4IPK0_9HYPH|nr:hypothetical protein [Methylorubrum salsuginis]SFL56349.1 hypothetical protein SAMN04488125_1187 [Methylorubrum salsuginis]